MSKQWIKGDLQGKSQFLFKLKELFKKKLKMNTENGSASEGSKKYHPEDSSPGPSTEKRRRRKRRRTAKYSNHDFQGPVLDVCCGNVKGILYKDKLAAGGSQKCIKNSEGKWYTPKEFEASGDRARWKTWRKSITCEEFPLEKLMKEGDLHNPPREYRRKKRINSKSYSGKTLTNIPGTLMGRRRRFKRIQREDPPRPPRQLAGSKLPDTAQKTFRTSMKRASKYNRIISPTSSSSSSPAASPTRQNVIHDDNLEGISSSPSISSKAIPAKFKPKLATTEVNAQVTETTAALSRPLRQRKQLPPVPLSETEEEMLSLVESEAAKEEELPPLEGSEEEELLPQGRSKKVLTAWAESEAVEKELLSRVEELPPADEDNWLPPTSRVEMEVVAPEMELGEEVLPLPTSTVTAAEELQMEAKAVPTADQRRRHRQRARCLTQCHCSALAPRVLAGIRAVRRDIQTSLGQNHSVQDRLLYLEGNARNMQRTLHLFQTILATREQHCTPATAAEEQALLKQLLEQNSTVLKGLLAIMARLGVSPFDPHF